MTEPKARAERIERVFPWLLHWTIADERIGDHRSDSFAVQSSDGLLLIDPVPLAEPLQAELPKLGGIFMTHGNHQRAVWRMREELGAKVYAPSAVSGLDEEPDVRMEAATKLPGGLRPVPAAGFVDGCYLTYAHAEGPKVLFCGDLICKDPDGPYRFPVQPGYFDPEGGRFDAARLAQFSATVLCAAHAAPSRLDCKELLEELGASRGNDD